MPPTVAFQGNMGYYKHIKEMYQAGTEYSTFHNPRDGHTPQDGPGRTNRRECACGLRWPDS